MAVRRRLPPATERPNRPRTRSLVHERPAPSRAPCGHADDAAPRREMPWRSTRDPSAAEHRSPEVAAQIHDPPRTPSSGIRRSRPRINPVQGLRPSVLHIFSIFSPAPDSKATPPIPTASPGSPPGLRPDDDLDVAVEAGQKAQQALRGKSRELVVLELGACGWECRAARRLALRELRSAMMSLICRARHVLSCRSSGSLRPRSRKTLPVPTSIRSVFFAMSLLVMSAAAARSRRRSAHVLPYSIYHSDPLPGPESSCLPLIWTESDGFNLQRVRSTSCARSAGRQPRYTLSACRSRTSAAVRRATAAAESRGRRAGSGLAVVVVLLELPADEDLVPRA